MPLSDFPMPSLRWQQIFAMPRWAIGTREQSIGSISCSEYVLCVATFSCGTVFAFPVSIARQNLGDSKPSGNDSSSTAMP